MMPTDFLISLLPPPCMVHNQTESSPAPDWETLLKTGLREPIVINAGRLSRTVQIEQSHALIRLLAEHQIEMIPSVVLLNHYGRTQNQHSTYMTPMELLIHECEPSDPECDENIFLPPSEVIKGFLISAIPLKSFLSVETN